MEKVYKMAEFRRVECCMHVMECVVAIKHCNLFRVIQILVQTGGRFLGVGLLALNRWHHLQLKI